MLTHTYSPKTFSEAAADGLLAGLAAGMGMALYLLGAEWLSGIGPAEMFGRFDPGSSGSPVVGALAHLAVSAVYGALFGGLHRLLPIRRNDWRLSALGGLAFGLAVWAGAMLVLLPAASPLRAVTPVHFAVAHAVYGLALGVSILRKER